MLFSVITLVRAIKVHLQYKSHCLPKPQPSTFLVPSAASFDVKWLSQHGDKFIYSLI